MDCLGAQRNSLVHDVNITGDINSNNGNKPLHGRDKWTVRWGCCVRKQQGELTRGTFSSDQRVSVRDG